jgi:hypothetical protein
MADDTAILPMTGWEKRDMVEGALKTGDAASANNILNTVQDQKLFMDLLASKAETDVIPGLAITADKDGTVHQIKTNKLTISDAGGHLTAEANNPSWGQYLQAKWDGVTTAGSNVLESVKAAASSTDLGDALRKSGTSDSLVNQGINARIKANGG